MIKNQNNYKCSNCGATASKWSGKCHSCLEWNSLQEIEDYTPKSRSVKGDTEFFTLESSVNEISRIKTGIDELDIVLGGGFVSGSGILLGGEPGIGKSTILMQVASKIADMDKKIHYYSGEESKSQILLRSNRLDVSQRKIQVSTLSNLEEIILKINEDTPSLIIVDSIQTSFSDRIEGIPGSINQVRYTCQELLALCKSLNIILILVGHVTKDGQLAGPKTIEHMVDTVLYFEADKGNELRLIRTAKNRYGSTSEVGIFKMTSTGLEQIKNPSSLFLSNSGDNLTGTSVFPANEGSRTILLEIQALVTPSLFATSKRTVVGWDVSRLSMLLAVLESRCDLTFSNLDIYLSIASGIKTSDPAADLAVAAALISSKLNFPLDSKTVIFGEINLSGTIRESYNTEGRIKEAEKLGFTKALISKNAKTIANTKVEMKKINGLVDFISYLKTISNSMDDEY